MFERKKTLGEVVITATINWDDGDPSVGIEPGFGERTGVEVKYGPFVMFFQWTDYDEAGRKIEDPADFIVEYVDVHRQEDSLQIPLIPNCTKAQYGARTLRLWEMPEVLEVVQEALDDFYAVDRYHNAGIAVQLIEGELDRVCWEAREAGTTNWSETKAEIAGLEAEIAEAREEVEEAARVLVERGLESMLGEAFTCPECGTEMIRSPIDAGFLIHVEPTDCAPDPWPRTDVRTKPTPR